MSLHANVTLTKKASSLVHEAVKSLYEMNPMAGKPEWSFSIWGISVVKKALEDGVSSAIKELDTQMKGWKPVAGGKETLYGVHGNHEDIEFWYQRVYTK